MLSNFIKKNEHFIKNYYFYNFLININYPLFVTGSITIRPLVQPLNRELVTFLIRMSIRFLKH